MSDKDKTFAAPTAKTVKSKRLTIYQPNTHSSTSTSSSSRIRGTVAKDRNALNAKGNRNMTVIGDADITISGPDVSSPDFDAVYRQIAYGKFMRAMLEECLVDEKIEREEKLMDIQLASFTDTFRKTMDQMDKTNRRFKEISFVMEQNRLLELKSNDYKQLHELSQKSDVQNMLNNLALTEQTVLDKLETKNVDFGYDKETGHKRLLEAVDEALTALEGIKKHSSLDTNKLKEYEKSKGNISKLQEERLDLEDLRLDFSTKYPNFSERLLKEASEKIATMIDSNSDESEEEDD